MSSAKIITQATEFCTTQKERLTPPRRYVLEILAKAQKPLVAYDILHQLAEYLDNPKPPTAYRAIEFWRAHGFIHRIESLNAYVLCHAGHTHKGSQYLICEGCGAVEEIHLCHLPPALQDKVAATGFQTSYWNAEIHGLCPTCQAAQ